MKKKKKNRVGGKKEERISIIKREIINDITSLS